VSVLSRKRRTEALAEVASVRDRTLATALQAVPVARQAVVPIAKSAGMAARHGTESAVAWAAPHVDEARAWVAPHIERSGLAIRDTIAPKISDALVTTAHRLDTAPPRRRRWPKVLAAVALLAAAGSAAAAIAMRRRPDDLTYLAPVHADDEDGSSATVQPGQRLADANGSQAQTEVGGQFQTS